ncbi:hypothetical protein [Acidocella aromatica]|uniref:Uncharacterized protein n=1 Tax=Acidocella aromatica TaxID=1303579 RepID=A0A840VJN7_9PROT|nr:hypothetical protein [Acidocella aromatica]MBB5372469.1 hypothetical protein [Acidocella aromatica]
MRQIECGNPRYGGFVDCKSARLKRYKRHDTYLAQPRIVRIIFVTSDQNFEKRTIFGRRLGGVFVLVLGFSRIKPALASFTAEGW